MNFRDNVLEVRESRVYKNIPAIRNKFNVIDIDDNEFMIADKIGNIVLRKKGSDVDAFMQVFAGRGYAAVVETAIINQIEIKTIVDAGSNIGLTSLYLTEHFPAAKIFGFEPDPDNYRQLVKNTGKFENISNFPKAVWSNDTAVFLHNDFRDRQDWAKRVADDESPIKIGAISLNTIMQQNEIETIDILKIDIEGSEREIFKDGSNLDFLPKTKIIAMEIHDEFNCREKIYQKLITHDFVLFNSGELTIGINPAVL